MDNSINASARFSLFSKWLNKAKKLLFAFNIIHIMVLAAIAFTVYKQWQHATQESSETLAFIEQPKIGDIYFLDRRKLTQDYRSKEKYRLAQVVDITGDIVTLRYGNMFYFTEQAAIDGIRYGQLRYSDYLEPKRYDYSPDELAKLLTSSAIIKIKRPKHNSLYGNYTSPDTAVIKTSAPDMYVPGKREHIAALSLLNNMHIEDNIERGLSLLSQSAQLGFAPAQVSLGEFYLQPSFYDSEQALYWFKQAGLQSHKPGILKYVTICKRQQGCSEINFYQQLYDAGVNIKVRQFDFELQ